MMPDWKTNSVYLSSLLVDHHPAIHEQLTGILRDYDTPVSCSQDTKDTWAPHYSDKTAVIGHTPQMGGEVLDLSDLKCIDTGCGYGGLLTALEVVSGEVWQVDEDGNGV